MGLHTQTNRVEKDISINYFFKKFMGEKINCLKTWLDFDSRCADGLLVKSSADRCHVPRAVVFYSLVALIGPSLEELPQCILIFTIQPNSSFSAELCERIELGKRLEDGRGRRTAGVRVTRRQWAATKEETRGGRDRCDNWGNRDETHGCPKEPSERKHADDKESNGVREQRADGTEKHQRHTKREHSDR